MAGDLREINLEQGMPTADAAVKRLTFEWHRSRSMGVGAMKLIHGYGSSGKGGKIRLETRRYLTRLKSTGQIRDFITGEDFSIFHSATLKAFDACPALRKDRDLERHNNGVTFVIL